MKAKPNNKTAASLLEETRPSRAIVQLAVPATLALLAKAIYNIVDTAYIGLLRSDTALAAVGVTLPILLIMVSVENIFSAGAAVLAGRQLGAKDQEGANRTVSTITLLSVGIGILLCLGGIALLEPILRLFGASDSVLPEAKEYAVWMFVAALANLPAQSLNAAARAESSARISSIAVITGAALNVILDPVFMFDWGLGMGVQGASIATTVSQFVTFGILIWFYFSGRSHIQVHPRWFRPESAMLKTVVMIGVPSALIQICLSVATSLTNIAASTLPDADQIIAAYGVVQRLVLIGCYLVMGFMQGYQPVASFSFGAKEKQRFLDSFHFALKGSIVLSLLVEIVYIAFSRPIIGLFNQNPTIIGYGSWLLISQVALYPAFGLCYMMTITFQTIGESGYGLFMAAVRQGLFYAPFILLLPGLLGVRGIYLSQPTADVLTLIVSSLSVRRLKEKAAVNMERLGGTAGASQLKS